MSYLLMLFSCVILFYPCYIAGYQTLQRSCTLSPQNLIMSNPWNIKSIFKNF